MGEKYEVPLKNETGDVIGLARIDPDEFPEGVIEVTVTDEDMKRALMPKMLDFSVDFGIYTERMGDGLVRPKEAIVINKENKE